jgi:putative PIN family toxin of toxin-antitoxin system
LIIVLDTNILVHAAFRRESDPDNLLVRSLRGEFELATSQPLLDELRRTLDSVRLARWYQWQESEADAFYASFVQRAKLVVPARGLEVVRDESDNRVLEAAVEAEADLVVSVDNDLLALGEFEGIRIVTEAEFVAILRAERL